jgi:hypothetical protein
MSPDWKNTSADAPVFYLINQIRSVSLSIQVVRQRGDRAVFARPLASPHFSSRIMLWKCAQPNLQSIFLLRRDIDPQHDAQLNPCGPSDLGRTSFSRWWYTSFA